MLSEYSFLKIFVSSWMYSFPHLCMYCCNTVVRYGCEEARLVPVELRTAFQTCNRNIKFNLILCLPFFVQYLVSLETMRGEFRALRHC